jgi:hypothetical protein
MWYLTFIFFFGALRPILMPVLTAYQFFFIVCRFCTSKQCFGYFRLWVAMRVLVEVLVHDWEKNGLVDKFWELQEYQHKSCFGKSKSIYQNFICLPFFAMPLGLSILQISITILDRHYLSQPLPNKVLCHKTHTQTHHNNQQDWRERGYLGLRWPPFYKLHPTIKQKLLSVM